VDSAAVASAVAAVRRELGEAQSVATVSADVGDTDAVSPTDSADTIEAEHVPIGRVERRRNDELDILAAATLLEECDAEDRCQITVSDDAAAVVSTGRAVRLEAEPDDEKQYRRLDERGQPLEPERAANPPQLALDQPEAAAELAGTHLHERQQSNSGPSTEPTKQGTLKILCPHCECQGEIPWGRLKSLLCCTNCWNWYRIDQGGRLSKIAAPKNITKGALRMYRKDGSQRIVPLTLADLERQRQLRAWSFRKFLQQLRPSGFVRMSMESIAVVVVLAYLFGIFLLGYYQFAGPAVPPPRPQAPALSSP
jgi:hypothetical protein